MNVWDRLRATVAQQAVCLVEVLQVQGSAPRGPGAWMAVSADSLLGTIGGGHLEWEALQRAREWIAQGMPGEPQQWQLALGPSLGQCCGGAVQVRMGRLDASNLATTLQRLQPPLTPVALFGAGHVGQAIVRVLPNLLFEVYWADSRDDVFPEHLGPQVHCEHSDPIQASVADLPAQSLVLIMSFSHSEDLELVCACLRRQRAQQDVRWIGLIGSDTKWAVFQRRLRERGFTDAEIASVTCPIGMPGVPGKEPESIAIAVAAQLLQIRHQAL
ncbi:MAG: xanthine dehydrogenase accessory protein XdhC [Comamonas sp.]